MGGCANMVLVLVGGDETTRNSIGHTMLRFAEQPDQWDIVRDDPAVLKTAVREMVRYASPVLHMRRTATSDTELGGQAIRRGNISHLGFGTGQHVCVGSRLAEMQLRVVFEILAMRVKSFELAGEAKRLRSNFINGLKSLPFILHHN
jgi:linalool 8-monooxygenase